ncbi:unnamed protein product, partial [Phaeothamnion confervicola]
MGTMVPAGFPMSLLKNDAERLVVNELCRQLSDEWLILPDVGITGPRDRQIDLVIAHPDEGIAIVEVKGHRAKVVEGMWCANGKPLEPQ